MVDITQLDQNSLRDVLAFSIASCDMDFRPVWGADEWCYARADFILGKIKPFIQKEADGEPKLFINSARD